MVSIDHLLGTVWATSSLEVTLQKPASGTKVTVRLTAEIVSPTAALTARHDTQMLHVNQYRQGVSVTPPSTLDCWKALLACEL